MALAKEVLKKHADRADDAALTQPRRELLEALWRLSRHDRDTRAASATDALPRTSTGVVLVLDRLMRCDYGQRHTRADAAGTADARGKLAAAAAWLLFWLLATSPRHLDCLAKTRAQGAGRLVRACVAGLDASRNGLVAEAALFALQKVAASRPGARVAIAEAAGKTLADLLDGDRGRKHRRLALHVLLNVSVDRRAVAPLARFALLPLVNVATGPEDDVDGETREFACSVLANVSRDKACAHLIYLHKLDIGFAPARLEEPDIIQTHVDEPLGAPSPGATPSTTPAKKRAAVTSPQVLAAPHDRRRLAFDDRRLEMKSGVSYGDWLRAAFPAEEHRLSSRRNPALLASRSPSEAFLRHPGRAATQWAKGPQALWEPSEGGGDVEEIFFVRSIHESTARLLAKTEQEERPRSAPVIARPRVGSHRIGPCGALGSCATRDGEDPWSPLVETALSDTTRRHPDAIVDKPTHTCVLAPGGARNTFAFAAAWTSNLPS